MCMGMIEYYHALRRAGKSADSDQSEGLLSLERLLKNNSKKCLTNKARWVIISKLL